MQALQGAAWARLVSCLTRASLVLAQGALQREYLMRRAVLELGLQGLAEQAARVLLVARIAFFLAQGRCSAST